MSLPIICLRWVVALQCLGIGGRYVFSENESESDVYGWLFFDQGFPESFAQAVDDWGAIGCVLAGLWVLGSPLIRGWLGDRSKFRLIARWLDFAALGWVTVWVLLLALTHSVRGGMYAEWALGEYAVRIIAPVAYLLLTSRPPRPRWSMRFMVLAAAATFAVHGFKAFELYGPFVDLILLSDLRWTGFGLEQSTAESALVVIGVVDMAVALILVLFRWRLVALYMFIWGVITAASRMTAFGASAWPETVIRAANWGVPLAIALLATRLAGNRFDEPSEDTH